MQKRIEKLIERVSACELFENVGKSLRDPSIKIVASWKEATAHCSSVEWSNNNLFADQHISVQFYDAADSPKLAIFGTSRSFV